MVTPEDIEELISTRKNRILTYAQVALPDSQYRAFRKLFLDELGKSGFIGDLERLLRNSSNLNTRNG